MDRNVVIATVLIGLIMFVWLYVLSPPPLPPPVEDQATVDTVEVAEPPEAEPLTTPPQAVLPALTGDSTMIAAQTGEERFITVETDRYQARFSTKGGTLVSFKLKDYKKFDQQTPVQLVDTMGIGAVGLEFQTPEGHNQDTRI